MLSVAFITDAPRVAGSEVWLRDLLPLLPAHGLVPQVFLPVQPTLERFAAELGQAGVAVQHYAALSDVPALTQAADLRGLQAWEPGTYRTLLPLLSRPRVVVSHDQLDYHYPAPIRALYRQIFRQTKAAAFAQADSLITVSQWGAGFLREPMGLKQVRGMHNGANTALFAPATPPQRQQLREKLEFTRFTVLVPGRFTLEKNQLSAVLAARYAPELDFVFVGDMDSGLGWAAQQLKQQLKLPNVRFLGRRWDMPDLYRAADALLQPTLAENQSLVTLEAMSSGLPIVTTSIPAQTELVTDGVSGLCVPYQGAYQPQLFALALQALARHPDRAAQMGRVARKQVLAAHTTAQSAAQLAQLLQDAARLRP